MSECDLTNRNIERRYSSNALKNDLLIFELQAIKTEI